jgi:hypothetical protein
MVGIADRAESRRKEGNGWKARERKRRPRRADETMSAEEDEEGSGRRPGTMPKTNLQPSFETRTRLLHFVNFVNTPNNAG